MCCVCRTRHPFDELIRVARPGQEGRGAHICKNNACIEKAIKTRALNRSFKTNIAQEVYDELHKHIAKPN